MTVVALNSEDALVQGVNYFDPEHYLITIVQRAVAHRQNILVSAGALGEIIILSARGECFARVQDMARFCKTAAETFKVEILKGGDPRIPGTDQLGRGLDELLWLAAFHASAGRLMRGCYRDDVVQLPYWPNLTRLPRTENAFRICALLSRHPTSITFAARLLKVEREELFQFYSAARCAGLARALNRKPEEPSLEPHRHRSLLSLLLGRMSGL